jgi:hypothetical protein
VNEILLLDVIKKHCRLEGFLLQLGVEVWDVLYWQQFYHMLDGRNSSTYWQHCLLCRLTFTKPMYSSSVFVLLN